MHIDVRPAGGVRSRVRSVGGSGRFPWCPTWRRADDGGTPKVVAIPVAGSRWLQPGSRAEFGELHSKSQKSHWHNFRPQ